MHWRKLVRSVVRGQREESQVTEQEQLAYDYWAQYHWAIPYADAEDRAALATATDYKRYLPQDPTDPRAWIPTFARYAKRHQVNFTCPVTLWKETDYFQDIAGQGPIRFVGRLTVDHIVPGARGGRTTDDNTAMICEFANVKKGSDDVSYDALRQRLLSTHRKIEEPAELLDMLRKYQVTRFNSVDSRVR